MSTALPHGPNRIAPRQQANWDWRAASNFIAGGSGGGLLLWTALVALHGGDARLLQAGGLALIAAGLTCVWFEIGRPWRALNTFRHFGSSWMTREASLAPLLFVAGLLAVSSGQAILAAITGLLGLAFLYAQARILAADKGIPAWRHPRCRPLVVATGLTEGAGLLLCASGAAPRLWPVAVLLAALVALRQFAWRRYLAALANDGAPAGAIRALRRIDARFTWGGNAAPAVLALLAAVSATPLLAVVAGVLAAAAGWHCKYTLVCRAAFTQGFALPKLPVRGRGTSGAGIKPGWEKSARRLAV
ncbi:MAG: dimethyl sulfoxide reductase anchor subunit [Rhodocyclaceae bacterium]|nr:dimethyl sulfoxide reductase anchor subunit [Rhodocyclaceae bacterium]